VPLSKTSNFTAYGRLAFELADHRRLAEQFAKLAEREVAALLSNSDTRVTRELFTSFRVETVSVKRAINSNAKKRGPITEILVSSPACTVVRGTVRTPVRARTSAL
jgi:DNA adenine methylase